MQYWLRLFARRALSLVVAVMPFAPVTAEAQSLFFDWGGEKTVADSGRETVQINTTAKPGELIVSFSDRRVYFITKPGEALAYPVAIPRDQDRWQGITSVSSKRENPSWTPTPTMRAENPRLPMWVPGGHPMNPLGIRALYLGSSMYRIHGTDAPWTVGTAVSKGCVRMFNKDVVDLYTRVKSGAKVTVTWQKFLPQLAAKQDEPVAAVSAEPASRVSKYKRASIGAIPDVQAATEVPVAAAPIVAASAPVDADAPVAMTRANGTRRARARSAAVTVERAGSKSGGPFGVALPDELKARAAAPLAAIVTDAPAPAAKPTAATAGVEPAVSPITTSSVQRRATRDTNHTLREDVSRALDAAERAAAAADRAAAAADRAAAAAGASRLGAPPN
jgi:hypothetical protein